MVSLWPWRSDDTSPALFEKALSSLSERITKSQLLLDSLRQRSRRFKALWTLYTSFAYLLCAVILALVVGWRNWGVIEYTALAGSPVIIYIGRTALDTYYTYRINSTSHRLEEQQTERKKTIDKLKAATKYNSTQQLLEKYGGEPPKPAPKPKTPKTTELKKRRDPNRTSFGPPPTANLGQYQPPSQPSTPQPVPMVPRFSPPITASPVQGTRPVSAEFAPNAFSSAPQYENSDPNSDGNWYDRILDLLLGEDETSAKNRVVLICQNCRLVNGQAPPGTKRLEDIGRWRCNGCGSMNGVEDEGTKVVEEIKEKMSQDATVKESIDTGEQTDVPEMSEVEAHTEHDQVDGNDGDEASGEEEDSESGKKKLRRRQSRKVSP